MIGLWIAAAAVTAVVLFIVVLPLLRRSHAPADRASYDRAVWRDQLAEIDRDVARGVLAEDQAEAARVEIKRRILAASANALEETKKSPKARRSPVLAAVLAVAVPGLAFGLYAVLGSPSLQDQPLASRTPPPAPAQTAEADAPPLSLEEAAERLRARLAERPEELQGWVLLGRTYMTLGRPEDAAPAFRRALTLAEDRPDIAAFYGEALTAAAGGRIGPEARAAFERALAGDPRHPQARYYLGLAKAQAGDLAGALQDWIDLAAIAPPDAPWLSAVREQIARAAADLGTDPSTLAPSAEVADLLPEGTAGTTRPSLPGPTREDVAAAADMSAKDRAAMVRAMVERLAARLEEDPDDIDGWRRLARAWGVLGEARKAAEARARAEALERR